MKFYIVDAFTETLFGGNPAGVVILDNDMDFPEYDQMLKTAAELRYSETAFIRQLDKETFNIRYFTPAAEVDLCGHATIGSFVALLEAGLVENGHTYRNITKAGELDIIIEDGQILMDMAMPEDLGTLNDKETEQLYKVMNCPLEANHFNKFGISMKAKMISTGLPDIMMPVKDKATLDLMEPDMKALAELSNEKKVVGVHAFTLGEAADEVKAYCRNFAPAYDIDEEAATGTSNGALTYYLYLLDLIKNGDSSLIIQGEKMGRPSKIITQLQTSADKVNIKVGGSGVVLASGDIRL